MNSRDLQIKEFSKSNYPHRRTHLPPHILLPVDHQNGNIERVEKVHKSCPCADVTFVVEITRLTHDCVD
ncbi:hypothetical protein L596_023051 [Steinernema carpocapsae]|uniref:Uncharacterized protein n=1 Tax=Steinernema carpocapsae TaxID=34508 RepID=A0A4U5MCJ2_STECR|nr:hypothetical protein L596_023051 [Steinernema carpocapsae]